MLRVLHIISDTNIGGAGSHLLAFLQNHKRDRLTVYVLCPPGSVLAEPCRKAGVPVIASPYLAGDRSFSWRGLAGLIRQVRNLTREYRIDLVHTHASLSGRIAAGLSGIPVVYTKHRVDWKAPGGIKKLASTLLNRFTCRRVIAVSEAVRQNLLESGMPGDKIELVYNGIDLEQFRARARGGSVEAEPGTGDGRVVGVVARLEPEKGHRYFLEAAARVLEKFSDARFLVVGTGSLAGELEQLARSLGIHEKVIFTGCRDDVPRLVALMDVMVVPSLTEAFGISLLEGMCLARPCVASAVGGLKEIAGEDGNTAFLVPPADAGALAEKIVFLLENPALAASMGARAALDVEKRFSAAKMSDKMTEIYYKVVNPKKINKF